MNVLLLRHAEATKNVAASFSRTEGGGDELTAEGRTSSLALADSLSAIEIKFGLSFRKVISSRSPRSAATAEAIATRLKREWAAVDGLESIRSGVLAGKREAEAWTTHPEYMKALTLYRAGLFNSYNIPEFQDKEDKKAFEHRVTAAFEEIVGSDAGDAVVIAQRSPITAILLHCARRAYGYPRDFFGHVQLDLGCISWIVANGTSFNITAVNATAATLLGDDFMLL